MIEKSKNIVSHINMKIKATLNGLGIEKYLLPIVAFSILEIILIEYEKGIKVFDSKQAQIVLNASYSVLFSYIFYFFNIVLPKLQNRKYYKMIILKKIENISKGALLLISIHVQDCMKKEITIESIERHLKGKQLNTTVSYIIYQISRVEAFCNIINNHASLLLPKLLVQIDELEDECLNLKYLLNSITEEEVQIQSQNLLDYLKSLDHRRKVLTEMIESKEIFL